jgi:hypothetical protein
MLNSGSNTKTAKTRNIQTFASQLALYKKKPIPHE